MPRGYTRDPVSGELEPKPTKAQRKVQLRTQRELEKAVGRSVAPVVGKVQEAAPTVAQKALVVAVGLAAYAAATAMRNAIAEGKTDPAFIVSLAFAKAHRALAERLGRQASREELLQLRAAIAAKLYTDEQLIRAVTPFGLGAFVNLVRRAL